MEADIGQKLDYLFGKATGNVHNEQRYRDMLRKMEKIGFPDTQWSRAFMKRHFNQVLLNPDNIAKTYPNGNVVRESLLVGQLGSVKIESIWKGNKLITFMLFGG